MSAITPKNVLLIRKDKWFVGGRELTKGEVDNLKGEAELIGKTALWKLIVNEGKYHAQKRAIECDPKDLKQVQEYHKVLVFFEEFIFNIAKSS